MADFPVIEDVCLDAEALGDGLQRGRAGDGIRVRIVVCEDREFARRVLDDGG